ncbi:MAG: hypothetical protein QXN37_01205 [Candidatus Anstonellaceae archaeon]
MHLKMLKAKLSSFCSAYCKKIKQLAFLVIGSISSFFGLAGFFGLCCSPLLGGLFALIGISSIAFLLTYDWLFLLVGGVFLLLFLISWKTPSSCPYKKTRRK